MVRPMVHSVKHYVQFSRGTVGTVSVVNLDVVLAVEGTTANAVDEVAEGSTIKAIYIELWLLDAGNDGSAVVTVSKMPIGTTSINFANMNALGNYTNKKNVYYTFQGLTPNDGIAQPVNVMKGWLKVPRSKQRFGLGDSLRITIANNSANDLFFCGFSTYKEYT